MSTGFGLTRSLGLVRCSDSVVVTGGLGSSTVAWPPASLAVAADAVVVFGRSSRTRTS